MIDRLRLLYLGNLGLAHDFESFAGLLNACATIGPTGCEFVGTSDIALRRLAGLLSSAVQWNRHPPVPFEQLPRWAAGTTFHYGIVTFEERYVGLLSPSKFSGYLALGLPLIYIGPPATNAHRVCHAFDAGLCFTPAQCRAGEGGFAARVFDNQVRTRMVKGVPRALAEFAHFNAAFLADSILSKVGAPNGRPEVIV